MDSPLEGDGFELPVSRQIGSGPGSLARDRGFADSPVEGTRFELSVPRPRLARVGAPCPRLRFLPRQHAFFRRNIMFNLPTFSSSPTPDPSSAWYPLDRNDLPCSWYVLSEFDGLVKPISGQPAGRVAPRCRPSDIKYMVPNEAARQSCRFPYIQRGVHDPGNRVRIGLAAGGGSQLRTRLGRRPDS